MELKIGNKIYYGVKICTDRSDNDYDGSTTFTYSYSEETRADKITKLLNNITKYRLCQ